MNFEKWVCLINTAYFGLLFLASIHEKSVISAIVACFLGMLSAFAGLNGVL